MLEWAAGKPVTIRTIDAGGDKPVPGFTVEEGNPFLGLRGIRLSLARPEIFRVQIRALLRAAVHGNLKVMFPMISVPEEYARAVALFAEEAKNLAEAGEPHAMPPLGIMVEVPSVAIAPELFADVAFFSIGSNDLTQYVMAAARDNTAVAALNSVTNPAVLRLISGRRWIRPAARHPGQPLRRCRRRSGGHPAPCSGPACATSPSRRHSWRSPRRPSPASRFDDGEESRHPLRWMPRPRSAPTRVCCRPSSSSVRRVRASGLPTRSASTAASSRRSPARPIRRRSRRSTCRRSSPSAISARRSATTFLAAYRIAHPGKASADGELRRTRHISLTVPDLGDAKQNAALDRAINDFVHRITSIAGKSG